jgi:hypothetical protein
VAPIFTTFSRGDGRGVDVERGGDLRADARRPGQTRVAQRAREREGLQHRAIARDMSDQLRAEITNEIADGVHPPLVPPQRGGRPRARRGRPLGIL